jgi:hypothetical protein
MNTTYGRVGDRINEVAQLDDLPVGSVMGERNGSRQYEKQADGFWHDTVHGQAYRSTQFSMGYNQIMSLPDGWTTVPKPPLSVEQFAWRYRDGALQQALDHGVSVPAVEEALAKMGAGRKDFPIGPGVRLRNKVDMENLPEDTIVYVGSPETPSNLGVWVKRNGRWVHILGERAQLSTPFTIDTFNGDRTPVDWVAKKGTEADDEAIRLFKARAWQVGYKLKRSQGWCSTYESIVNSLGVTQNDLNNVTYEGYHVGDHVDPEEARMLPHGSLLRWQSANYENRFALYLRVRGQDNRAGTRRVGHFKDRMEVVFINAGGADMLYRIQSPAEFALFPPGTRFQYNDGDSYYIVCNDGRVTSFYDNWTPAQIDNVLVTRGQHSKTDFGNIPRVSVTYVPHTPEEE